MRSVGSIGCVLALILLPLRSLAAVVQPDDMFFAPSSLVEDLYPNQDMTGDGTTTPWQAVWVASDIQLFDPSRVDITFVGIEVLPVLIENPSPIAENGVYTEAELAAVDVSNYSSYFLQVAGTDINDLATDYVADLESSQITLTIASPGVYAVRIQTQSRGGVGLPMEDIDYIYSQHAGDDVGITPWFYQLWPETCVHRRVTMYDTQCYVVALPNSECVRGENIGSECLQNSDCQTPTYPNVKCNHFNRNAAFNLHATGGKSVCRAANAAEAVACIEQCKADNGGEKVEVTIIAHGTTGAQKLGTTWIGNFVNPPAASLTPLEFQAMIDASVKKINFFSCKVGDGPEGDTFVREFASSISGGAHATRGTVTAARNGTLGGRGKPYYFDQCALANDTNSLEGEAIPDSDGDGVGNNLDLDDDDDGLPDTVETDTGVFLNSEDTGTSPLFADTDGDGFSDLQEVNQGSNPVDATSTPGAQLPSMGLAGRLLLGVLLALSTFPAITWLRSRRTGDSR